MRGTETFCRSGSKSQVEAKLKLVYLESAAPKPTRTTKGTGLRGQRTISSVRPCGKLEYCFMQELIRKSLKLFGSFPILWLPFVCAQLCALGLTQMRMAVLKQALQWGAATHSVLAPHVSDLTAASGTEVRLIAAVLGGTVSYVTLCLETTAMVLTAFLVFKILKRQRPNLAVAVTQLRAYPARILWYSFLLFALATILNLLVGIPVLFLSHKLSSGSSFQTQLFRGEYLVVSLFSAWIIAPIALALLRPRDASVVSPLEKERARYTLVLATAVVIGVGLIFDPIVARLTEGLAHQQALVSQQTLVSLVLIVLKTPYVWSFIALALITGGDADEEGPA